MKRFVGFLIKEVHHIFRDRRTMLILFGMPIAQILLFGYVITNEIKDTRVAIYDASKDQVTSKLTNKILSSGFFMLEENLQSVSQIEGIFKKGKVKEVIIFEPDFAKKLERNKKANIQLIADASDANMANLVINYTNGIIMDFNSSLNESYPGGLQIIPEVRMMFNEELKGVFMFIPGIMAMILMLVSALMTSISLTREKELGTMEILLASPLKASQIIIGKVTPYMVLSFINAVTIILLGRFVFGMPIRGNIALLLAECLLFNLLALSLGIFISTKASNQQIAMFISMVGLMLPTILLSGFIFPIENMPKVLQWLTVIVPPKYFVIIIKNIMLKGTDFSFVWKETLVLMAMSAIFIGLSIKSFKVRLM